MLQTESATVGEVRITRFDWDNPKQPAFADIEYKKVRIPSLAENPGFKEFASVTGQSELVINAKASYTYDKATKIVDLRTGEVSTVPGSENLFSPRWSLDSPNCLAHTPQ